ncbi:uncharacterized protein LOC129595856 [Paramacrobiotus metropolitanus]|uniref:uncharacterized protein LOC129595856 n=1 Tax=Paramacrobiotus metropolitanus TaxID=2943436 RepID=UPI00244595B7|nr:uncharacterized protein LOC129595856 [Paramacrobiotus metropolitanus]
MSYFQRLSDTSPSFPAEYYTPAFVRSLIAAVYQHGKPLTPQENLFLISLPRHSTGLHIAHDLLTSSNANEAYQLQFAAHLLTQSLEHTPAIQLSPQLLEHLVQLLLQFYQADDNPVAEKVCRQLLAGVGMLVRMKPDWKVRFRAVARALQPDFFETHQPPPKALNVFFVFVKFNTLRNRGSESTEWECVEIVVDYFNQLLNAQMNMYTPHQVKYLRILSDWYAETSQRFGTPTEHFGHLVLRIAQYIDCPARQSFPWGDLQMQAVETLGELLQNPDIHLLQNSLIELLRIILQFPMNERVQTLVHSEGGMEAAYSYLETIARVLLKFSFEFADIVVACSEDEKTRGLFYEYVRRLCVLSEPFPEKNGGWDGEARFSQQAILAFREFLNLIHEMCGTGSEVSERLLPDFKIFFGILIKKACLPPPEMIKQWNQEERESFASFRADIQLTMEAFAAAVGTTLYEWFGEEFDACLNNMQHKDAQIRLTALCHLLRFSYNAHLPSELITALFEHLDKCMKVASREVVCEAFAAMGVWIPLLAETNNQAIVQNVITIALYGMREKDVQLTGVCATVLTAVADVDVKELLRSYADVAECIKMNLVGKVGNRISLLSLFAIWGHMIASLVPENAVPEVDGVYDVFDKMLQSVPANEKQRLLKTASLFPAFFQALGRHMEDEQLPGAYRVYEAIARLGLRLLDALHSRGVFGWNDPKLTVDDTFADLIKPLLCAAGPAVGNILHVVVPFVENSLSRRPTAGIMRCIVELLTKYLDRPGCEDLFARLTMHTINSVMTLSEATDWMDHFMVYRPFVLAIYPVVRQQPMLFSLQPVPWEKLIAFVAKLICTPPSGDEESQVQISVLFEELLRMKPPKTVLMNGENHFKTLVVSSYGEKFIEQFLRVFRNPYAHDAEVKVCCECFYAMLAELPAETKHWIESVIAAVNREETCDPNMAFVKLLSSILAQRSKSGVARQVSTYRQKFILIPGVLGQ